MSQYQLSPHLQKPFVNWDLVRQEFNELIDTEGPGDGEAISFDAVLRGESSATVPEDKIKTYTERLGATLAASPTGHVFVNGKHFNLDDVSLSGLEFASAH